jgi:hypothetical protein
MLPESGELVPDAADQPKLAALEPVLAFHDRHGVLAVKVIDLPEAVLVIYQRSVLLVARPAFRLLSTAELQAAVAHEIGHEYFWSEFEDTRLAGDVARQQTLELKCDGIAALTMLALGFNVSRLGSAMRRMIEFNETLGATTDTTAYPTVQERERFVRNLVKRTAGRGKQTSMRASCLECRWQMDRRARRKTAMPGPSSRRRPGSGAMGTRLDKALETQLANIQSRTGKSLAELAAITQRTTSIWSRKIVASPVDTFVMPRAGSYHPNAQVSRIRQPVPPLMQT